MNDDAYFILSEGIPALIDRALATGASFDEVMEEIRQQLNIAEDNRDEYVSGA